MLLLLMTPGMVFDHPGLLPGKDGGRNLHQRYRA